MKLLLDLFLECADRYPDKMAISDGERSALTYCELRELSLRIAALLKESGVKKGDAVAIELPREKEYVAAMFGCWLAGAAFAAQDANYPEERRSYVRRDCDAAFVLNQTCIDRAKLEMPLSSPVRNAPSDVAMLVYTSGSTGKPKGVIHDHESIAASIARMQDVLQFSESDVYGMCSAFTFIAVLLEVFAPLAAGASMLMLPDDVRKDVRKLEDFLYDHSVTSTFISPKLLMRFSPRNEALRIVITGTERVSNVYLDKAEIVCFYGLSESALGVTAFVIDKPYENTPIGKPLRGVSIYLLDEENRSSDEGEICIAAHISNGYRNLPEQTAKAYIDNPFMARDGHPVLFRTGDLGRRLPDGNLLYLNRKDWMVKINGQRVEPGEVEAQLRAIPEIADAAVKGFENEYGQTYLSAYYTEKRHVTREYLREALLQTLAPYMVPAFFVRLDALPLNQNGKLDRLALTPPDASLYKAEYTPPENDVQARLCEGFERVLNVEQVGIDDDFFALGGDSIKTVLLAERCAELKLYSLDVFSGRTPRGIEKLLHHGEKASYDGLDVGAASAPLTDSQLGVYLECVGTPERVMYNIPVCYRFPADSVDADRLARALKTVVGAYAAFSVKVSVIDGQPRMARMSAVTAEISLLTADEADIPRLKREFVRPFDLENGPLYRFEIIETGASMYLLFDMHHIVCDGASIGVFERALGRAYAGETPTPERVNAFMLAQFEERAAQSEHARAAHTFFERKLAGVEVDSNLPFDHPSERDEGKGGKLSISLPIDIPRTEQFTRAVGVTENTLFLAAFAYALAKFTGQDESLFCTVDNGRHDESLRDTMGMLVRTLPIYLKIDETQGVIDYIKSVQSDFFDTLAHDDCSFVALAREYGVRSDVMFVYQAETLNGFAIGDASAELENIASGDSISKLSAMIYRRLDGYELSLEYRAALYEPSTMRRFAEGFAAIIDGFMKCAYLRELNFTSEADLAQIARFNDTDCPFDENVSVVELLREQVRKTPDATAIVYLERTYTYREYDELTDRIAAHLNSVGIGCGDVVSVLVPRCEYMPIAAIGALKSGAAYQPLDPTYPPERLEFMVKDASAKLLIADRSLSGLIPGYAGTVLFTDELAALPAAAVPTALPRKNDAFVLLYTSGTTGKPKGCVLTHKNVAAFSRFYIKAMELSEHSRVSCYASFGFDANVMETYPTLLSGAQMHILAENIRLELDQIDRYYIDKKITHAFMTTQVGRQFAAMTHCPTLRHMVVGGEKLAPFKPQGSFKVHNGYGPSECTVFVSKFIVRDERTVPPIGKPNDNTKLYVVDAQKRQLPIGVPGEMYIAGAQVSLGYLNRPEQTAKAFVQNPFSDDPKYARAYRTGDIVRWLPDGNLEFVGRRDGQVKVRGFRIELAEVERVIREFPGVKDATVVAKDAPSGGKMLIAYVVSDDAVNIKALNDFILSDKPPYMVPAVTMQIDKIPLNVNGKVDKRKLPEPTFAAEEEAGPRAETRLEKQIGTVLEGVLGHHDFSVTTDLNIAGLSSISAIKLASELNKRFGFSPNVKELTHGASLLSIEDALVAHLLERETPVYEAVPECRASYPLTQTQLGIYFECMRDEFSDKYNIPVSFRLRRDTDLDRLERAIYSAVKAHPFIKCKVLPDAVSGAVMVPQDDLTWKVERREISEDERRAAASGERVQFKLDKPPLFAFELCRTEQSAYLSATFHHVIMDGTSISVLFRDIERAFNGETLVKESYTSFDLALDEQAARAGDAYTEAKAYYDSIFGGVSVRSLPEPDVFGQPESVGEVKRVITGIDTRTVKAFCDEQNVTPNALFTAGFAYALGKLTGNNEALFAAIYNGRTDPRAFEIMGMLVKTYPIYVPLDDSRSVAEFVSDMKRLIADLTANDLFSFAEASRAYSLSSDIIFAYQDDGFSEFTIAGQQVRALPAQLKDAKSPLNVDVFREGDGYAINLEYRADLYSLEYMGWFADVYAMIVSGLMRSNTLGDIALASDGALKTLEQINDTDFPVTQRPAYRLLEESAERFPERVAVIAAGEKLTYAALNARANRVAHGLIRRGICPGGDASPEKIVALMLPRDARIYIARQGILKSGGAFLTIDPQYPDERVSFMLTDSRAARVIVTQEIANARADLFYTLGCAVDVIDDLLECADESNPGVSVGPDALCYCIYTSGSTGKPKGVLLTQHNLVNFVDANPKNPEILGYTERAHVSLALAATTFDVSVMEEFIPLAHGMTICMAGEEEIHNPIALAKLMNENRVDMMSCTPSFLLNIADLPVMRDALSHVVSYDFGAEAFPPSLYAKICAANKDAYIMNGYGPTEATISCTMAVITDPRDITIGRPAANVKAYIVDAKGRILPPGVCGELVICGAGVGRGYIGRDELTREKFVRLNGLPAYRTGDLAEYTAQGMIRFHGRTDHQVKLRGLRVELGEIENAINAYPGVLTSLVKVCGADTSQFLAAYFTASSAIDRRALQAEIAKTLTQYMVPSVFIQMDAMPLTANGKIDKAKLPEPEYAQSDREYAAPRNDVERGFCELFQEILNLTRVGATDDFFELGGTSLTASRIAMFALERGYKIMYGDIFKASTPRALARLAGNAPDMPISAAEVSVSAIDDLADYDYTSLTPALAGNVEEGLSSLKNEGLRNILLTGATGFLGVHVLRSFLEGSTGTAYCLVRPSKSASPEQRLKTMLVYYFDQSFDEQFASGRIVCIDGDITDEASLEALQKLPFTTLVNCAACVKHFAAGDVLERVNVAGVKNLIALCARAGRRLIQVSTVSIAGEGVDGNPPAYKRLHENELYFGQRLDNAYIHSKFMAERAVLEGIAGGRLDAKIMRVGNLSARHSDGEFQINFMTNGFMRRLRGYKLVKAFPIGALNMPVEFSEIDATAEAILRLSATDASATVFHPYNNHLITFADVVYVMRDYGFELKILPDDAFQRHLNAEIKNPIVSDAVGGLIAYMSNDAQGMRYMLDSACDYTTQALYRLGFKWPITDSSYVRRMIKALDGLGMFDARDK